MRGFGTFHCLKCHPEFPAALLAGHHPFYGAPSVLRRRLLGSGDIDIDTESVVIETKGVFSRGVIAQHKGEGSINLDIRGGSVKTTGAYGYGIYGILTKTDYGGTISIRTGGGHAITTTGDNGHGIVAYNSGTLDTSTIDINVGGSIETTGAGSQGVRVGTLSSGAPARVAAIDDEGYRQQTVTVNGSVMGNAAGIFLAGGGRVVIGPQGSVGAASGIAILATGDTPGADPLVDPPVKPKLRVDMNLVGRRVAQAIGNDWIMNDGGETTIAVNNIVLHEGATGTTGRTAPNGAWNVTMREEGVTVNRDNPDNWVISEPATGVVTDRDFSVQDFMQAIAGRAQVARAQCSDSTLTTQAPITNEEAADSTTDLSVNADGVKISRFQRRGAQNRASIKYTMVRVTSPSTSGAVAIETSGTSNTGDEASGVLASSDSATNPATNEGRVKD